jgi:hypothetical protein
MGIDGATTGVDGSTAGVDGGMAGVVGATAGVAGALCGAAIWGTATLGGVASSSVAACAAGSRSANAIPVQIAFMTIQILEVLRQRVAIV